MSVVMLMSIRPKPRMPADAQFFSVGETVVSEEISAQLALA
jgi:hypothetical protein